MEPVPAEIRMADSRTAQGSAARSSMGNSPLLDPEMNSMERTVMPPSRMERGNTIIMEMTPGRMEAVSMAAPHTVRPGKVQKGAIPTEDHPTALPEGEQAEGGLRCGRRKEISGRSFRSF